MGNSKRQWHEVYRPNQGNHDEEELAARELRYEKSHNTRSWGELKLSHKSTEPLTCSVASAMIFFVNSCASWPVCLLNSLVTVTACTTFGKYEIHHMQIKKDNVSLLDYQTLNDDKLKHWGIGENQHSHTSKQVCRSQPSICFRTQKSLHFRSTKGFLESWNSDIRHWKRVHMYLVCWFCKNFKVL